MKNNTTTLVGVLDAKMAFAVEGKIRAKARKLGLGEEAVSAVEESVVAEFAREAADGHPVHSRFRFAKCAANRAFNALRVGNVGEAVLA